MRVRGRLVLAFAYILLTVIVALEVPLALNLERRAMAELEAQALAQAQTIASTVRDVMGNRARLSRLVRDYARNGGGPVLRRVIVVGAEGRLLADSAGTGLLGTLYATASRPELVAALRRGTPQSRLAYSETLRREILATAVPVLRRARPVGAVRITHGTDELQGQVRRTILGLVAIGLAGLAAGLLIAFILAGSLSRPLRRLAEAAARLGRGDLSARTGGIRGAQELEEVARSFDDMASRLEATVRAQREFAANASHQLRTPLTGLKLRLESAAMQAKDERLRLQLEGAEREADRLAGIVDRLLLLAREIEKTAPGRVDVGDAARRALARWEEKARRAGATLEARGDGGLAAGVPADVEQILDNLLDNAISYAPGPVLIESGRTDGRVFLAVEDRGPGIPPDEAERVTERFYRGRHAPPGGSGLGLAIVRELAERWGGKVRVATGKQGGTRVEVQLRPLESRPAGASAPADPSP